jgi:hypothetical protein
MGKGREGRERREGLREHSSRRVPKHHRREREMHRKKRIGEGGAGGKVGGKGRVDAGTREEDGRAGGVHAFSPTSGGEGVLCVVGEEQRSTSEQSPRVRYPR